tara:strand:+ start:172 stop:456 length:285 start_codon:yes stop_codon:yes gene_type:complete
MCDEFLNLFQLSKLCNTCYHIRTIIKAYNSNLILEELQNKFLVIKKDTPLKLKDINDKVIEETKPNLNKNLMEDLKKKLKHHNRNLILENDEID